MDRFERLMVTCMSTPTGIGPDAPLKQCPWGINMNAIGGSGVAKSARIRAVGVALGLPVFSVFVATKAPEHFSGYPVMTPQGFRLECALPQFYGAYNAGRAILFLDEISSASRAVQAALLSFVNEREVGEYRLPPGVRIMLAMNPPDVAANGRGLELPMANRLLHYNYPVPTLAEWRDVLRGEQPRKIPNISDSEAKVTADWRTHYTFVSEATFAFIESNNGVLKKAKDDEAVYTKYYDQPDAEDVRATGPWPSLRTWHWAINGVTAARCLGFDMTTQSDVVAGLVGKGIATEWAAYIKEQQLPHPRDVLTNGWTPPKQLDIVRIVLTSCAVYATRESNPTLRLQYGVQCWKLLHTAAVSGYADLVRKPAEILTESDLNLMHTDPQLRAACDKTLQLLNGTGVINYINRGAES